MKAASFNSVVEVMTKGGHVEICSDWLDLLQLMLQFKVRFVIVGGHAMGAHGLSRATKDLDIFVDRSPENAERVRRSLVEFMGDDKSFAAENFTNPDNIAMLGVPPHRIGVLTSIAGVSFEQVFENHSMYEFGDLTLPFIGRDELIINKKAAGRPQDLADVARLEQDRKDV